MKKAQATHLGSGKPVDFTFERGAFKEYPSISCCGKKVKKEIVDYNIPNSRIKVKLGIFKCSKCGEEFLDIPNAKILDKALEMNRLLNDGGYSMKRKLSFDGDNFILRVPNDFTKCFGKKASVEITPVSNDSFFVNIKK